MKKLNPNFIAWLLNLLGMILVGGMILLVLLAVATGCSPAKRIEKAKQTVLLDGKARHDVFLKELELYPCANDSFTVFLPGGIDSIPFPVPVLDTQKRNRVIDSLQNLFSASCDAAVSAAFESGYNNALNAIKGQKSPQKRPDTLLTSIKDKMQRRLDVDSINSLKQEVAFQKGQKKQWEEFAIKSDKEKQKLLWWLIAAVSALVLSNGLWIYAKIRIPKLPKL